MLAGAWTKLTAPRTHFQRGYLSTPEQTTASARVDKLESEVRDIGIELSKLPLNDNGSVYVKGGRCQFKEGQVENLDLKRGNGSPDVSDQYTVKSHDDQKEIHKVHLACLPGGGTVETDEWAIFEGHQISYQTCQFATSARPW